MHLILKGLVWNRLKIRNEKRVYFLLMTLFIFLFTGNLKAQQPGDLSRIRVEELSDEQISQFVMEANRLGVKDEQVEIQALQGGMNPDEIIKLRARIAAVKKSINSTSTKILQQPLAGTKAQLQDSAVSSEKKPLSGFYSVFTILQAKNFGSEVFANPRSTFEPNLALPTPKNYTLAAGDELMVDIFGYSDATYRLKVSPDGYIRIPLVGPVFVNGVSIEQAKKKITGKLASTVYKNIKSGRTGVDITLIGIRSIKVTIIGEAVYPGTYTLPSVASVYNALYACSGINQNGSYRNIQVIRNSTVITEVDVYDYLVNGSKKNDITLKEGDVIKINTYNVRVELKGEVKRPGVYDVAEKETLAQIIQFAGGFTDNAYRNRLQVFSNTDRDRQITSLKETDIKNKVPRAGDTYIIGKILNRFQNRVSIKGAVYRPGEYQLKEGMTLLKLVEEADGLREDAFLSRGVIHRLKDDLSPEIISFDLEKIKKHPEKDVEIKREDRVTVYSKFDLKEGYYVTISGEVLSPGAFLYEEGITVQDLVLMAGGLKEAASLNRIEVSRRMKSADSSVKENPQTAIIFQKDINMALRDSSGADTVKLSPFDEVTIYASPGYYVQKNVVIEGEIKYAGKYTLQGKNDRISDLVKRAGGITNEAYLKGAVLVRTRNYNKSVQKNTEQGLVNLLKQNYSAGAPVPFLQLTYDEYVNRKSDNVGIDLEEILDDPYSSYDLLLNDGDTLRIPKELQTVRVSGEVFYPALVRYDEELRFKDYISSAGGFNERSARRKVYVVNANGSSRGTKSFFFFRKYPKVSPGSEIFIPVKRERARMNTLEGITLGTTLVTLTAILLNYIKK